MTTERASYNKTSRRATMSTYWSARVNCGCGICKGGRKNTTRRVEIFSDAVYSLPLQICFIVLSERPRNTLLPVYLINKHTLSLIDFLNIEEMQIN